MLSIFFFSTPFVLHVLVHAVAGLGFDRLAGLSILQGINAYSSELCSGVCIGANGDYVMEFENQSSEDVILVLWGPEGSWVNAKTPLVTYELSVGSAINISLVDSTSGGWSAVYSDTILVNGQISNTWGEFTYDGHYSTFDVSRLPNMTGHGLSIQSTLCTADMQTCVFVCTSDDSCQYDYELLNCKGVGASAGSNNDAPSGGCSVGPSNYVKAVLL
ncbi:hypothetical protein D6C78_10212 [Aureobasidium pullulans]|uniref:Apple domain-containing protein n=1 Tax=Aureobasidium pullulans TaxID=5580 RepID=A0A4T0B5V6_AURPU|nr:hypothetical protein D6C78_10212 [Aureobasidium pullulans]